MEDNKLELGMDNLEEVAGGTTAYDVYSALDDKIKQYKQMGLTREQLVSFIQAGGPLLTSILKNISVDDAVKYVQDKWSSVKI
ncbi:MAG: hypothetical protein J5778_03030 [Clostridiales bacterium]|nr:hypothetical protein [Clostridiales bacterium]